MLDRLLINAATKNFDKENLEFIDESGKTNASAMIDYAVTYYSAGIIKGIIISVGALAVIKGAKCIYRMAIK